MWYSRIYEGQKSFLKAGKVNLLYGPRRVGKTALLKKLLQNKKSSFAGDGDDIQIRKILSSSDKNLILSTFSNYKYIFIDEAQRINNIGWGLKIMVDNLPDTTIIASGSSSFQLSSEVGAPLAGRTNTHQLFPISSGEIQKELGGMVLMQNLENYLIFGMYPDVLNAPNTQEKSSYLLELRNSYLLKDILEMENIRNSDTLYDLLRLLAFQIGKEVSLTELGNALGLAKQTITRYLDLLEKSFIIKRIDGFARNLRKEVTKTKRYYFYDNGIRNSIINNFNPISMRDDIGQLWENYMVMERLKTQHYKRIFSNNFFWRTYDQKEVDWVEEREGKLFGYEFKWNPKKIKIQKEWLNTYPNASFETIHNSNFLDFIQ